MMAHVEIMVFCDVTLCSMVDRYQRFGKTWWFHVQNGRAKALHYDPPTVKLRNLLLEGAAYSACAVSPLVLPFDEVIRWLEKATEVLQERAAEEVGQETARILKDSC
jgi:hypothetical protein